jgi:phage terminase small subunit
MEFCEGGFNSIAEYARKYQLNPIHVRNEFRKLNGSRSKILKDVEGAKKCGRDERNRKRIRKATRSDDNVSPVDSVLLDTIQNREPIQNENKLGVGGRLHDENGLTIQQETFVNEYLIDFNGARACIAAGYSQHTASKIAWELIRKPAIQRMLQQEAKNDVIRLGINRERILFEYARIAFGDVGDYVSFGQREITIPGGKKASGKKGSGSSGSAAPAKRMVNYVDLNSSSKVDTSLISEISQGKDGIKVKLHDKMKALDKLDKYFDLLPDNWKRMVEEERLAIDRERLEIEKAKAGNGEDVEKASNERIQTLAQLINNPEPNRNIEDFETDE